MGKRKATKVADNSCPAKKARQLTVEQRAAQKIRDNFAMLSDEEVNGIIDPTTSETLRGRLERDIKDKDEHEKSQVTFGKWYNQDLICIYRSEQSIFKMLAPKAGDDSVVAPRLMEV